LFVLFVVVCCRFACCLFCFVWFALFVFACLLLGEYTRGVEKRGMRKRPEGRFCPVLNHKKIDKLNKKHIFKNSNWFEV
jgi:hypothetical protein